MMKLSSLLGITLSGLLTYLLLEIVFGSYGLLAFYAMEEYARNAEAQLAELEETQAELRGTVYRLTTDRETIRLEARDIGFIRPEETVVRLEGHNPRQRHRYMPGTTPPPIPVTRDNRPLFRALSLALTLIALFVETVRTTSRKTLPTRRRDDWDVEVDGESYQL